VRAFLDAQIDHVQPKLIVALGKTAASRLLETEASLSSLAGRVHATAARRSSSRTTGLPAANAADKAKAWEDLLFARRTLARSREYSAACVRGGASPSSRCPNFRETRTTMRKLLGLFAVTAMLVLSGCGYNDFQTKDEQVKAAWARC
jgi:hypothetical protein